MYYVFNEQIVNLFTASKAVKTAWQSAILAVTISVLPDHWQTFQQGVIKGLGIQETLVNQTLFIYWVVNLPLIYFLTFVIEIGFQGLWVGICLS